GCWHEKDAMNLFAPPALAFGALIPVLILFYLLKVRRQEMDVSSTYLWEQLHRDLAAHEPWQRLKTSLLLLLQALLMALLVFGLARPFFTARAQASDNVVILLDASASMQATDVKPNRFAAAVAAAKQIVGRLSDDATGTIVRVTEHPAILVQGSATKAQMYDALAHVTVSSGSTNMAEALQLALSLNKGKTRSQIFIISDGAFSGLSRISTSGADIHFIPIGKSSANQGITTLSARSDPTDPRHQEVFVRVRNFASHRGTNLLSLYGDGKVIGSTNVSMPAHGSFTYVFPGVATGIAVVEARLRNQDVLAADNIAWLVLNQATASKVLLVTRNNLFLEKAVNLLPNVEVFKVDPRRYNGIDPGQFNLFIFDGFLPGQLPNGNMLIVNPPATDWLPVSRQMSMYPKVTSFQTDSQLLSYVNFNEVRIEKTKVLPALPWARVLAQSGSRPLLLAGNNGGRRMVILPFDLHWSNFGLLSGFPIFISNVISYLQPANPDEIKAPAPGDSLLLQPVPQADEIDVLKPNGATQTFRPAGKPVPFASTDAVGLYHVTQKIKGKALQHQVFAINLTNAEESNIAPRTSLDIGGKLIHENQAVQWTPARREIWPWILLAAIALLTFEWYWYHRRA
ncbi:MAG: VWA domain-containing protein, partial [Chloroflexota bacterium]